MMDGKSSEAAVENRRALAQRFLPWAFGFAPVLLFLLTWTDHFHNWWIKTYALPVVAVELTVVAVAFKEGMRIRLNALTACLVALLLLAWITAFLAPRSDLAFIRTALWSLHALFGFSAAWLFHADDLVDGMLAGFVAFAAVLVLFVISAPPDFNWIYHLPGLGNIRRFGFYAAAVIGLCLGRLGRGKSPAAAILTLAFAMAFWSGSRGAVIAGIAGLAVSILLFPTVRQAKIWGPFLGCAILGAALAAAIGSPEHLQGVARLTDTSTNGRVGDWRAAVELIGDRPWFGYGEGQMRDLANRPYVMHPHNIILQLMLAWGIVGLIIATVLGFWAAHKMFVQVNDRTLPLCAAAIILAGYSLIDGALYNVHPVAIFAACVGVTLASGRQPVGQSVLRAAEAD